MKGALDMEQNKQGKGLDYLCLALYAFGGLGLEILLAFAIEPVLYGRSMSQWSVMETIIHWILTCILWGMMTICLINKAMKNYAFDVFQYKPMLKKVQWLKVMILGIGIVAISYWDWNGFKIIKEYQNKGLIKFIFQYIYYFFEVGLFTLIIVFGQKAGELWFKTAKIPFGGMVLGLSWGLAHILTKGSIRMGLELLVVSIVFGSIYLILRKDIKKAYLVLAILFVL